MADTKIPLEPPPNYEDAAAQHGTPAAPMAKPLPRGPFPLDIPVLTQLRGKRVVLASASPRRKQLLGQACVSTPYPSFQHRTRLPSPRPPPARATHMPNPMDESEITNAPYRLGSRTSKSRPRLSPRTSTRSASAPSITCFALRRRSVSMCTRHCLRIR
jgi:hypothetical protein